MNLTSSFFVACNIHGGEWEGAIVWLYLVYVLTYTIMTMWWWGRGSGDSADNVSERYEGAV